MGPRLIDACIIELGQVISGTFGGALLADMGAEVIKVEPFTGDAARNPHIAGLKGYSGLHLTFNRNKKSVALDLKTPGGRETFYDLVRTADVVLDNFRPGVTERLGVGAEQLRKINPNIITVSVTGFGLYGKAKDRPAFDLVIQAYSGHMHITGDPDGPPAAVGVPLADLTGGLYAAMAVLAALYHREKTGRGTRVDVSMLDGMVSLLSYYATVHLNGGKAPERMGSSHAYIVPWQAFPTKDGYVVITVRGEKFWPGLCQVLGHPEWAQDPRFSDNAKRVQHRRELTELMEPVLRTKTTAEWLAIFESADIPAAPVNDFDGVFSDPQVQERGLVKEYDHPVLGKVRYVANPLQFEGWEHRAERAPELGEDTIAVLRERLGYDDAKIQALLDQGAIRAAGRV